MHEKGGGGGGGARDTKIIYGITQLCVFFFSFLGEVRVKRSIFCRCNYVLKTFDTNRNSHE